MNKKEKRRIKNIQKKYDLMDKWETAIKNNDVEYLRTHKQPKLI